MTQGKVLEVIENYRARFIEMGIGKIQYPAGDLFVRTEAGLEHCHFMLDAMTEFVREGRMEKANRWLGFIQGVLWSYRVYTIDDFKNHNRPSEKESGQE